MKKLNIITVFFNDCTKSYKTNVSAQSTVKSVTKYFLNTSFDVGNYPNENIQKCIGLHFQDVNNGTDHFVGNCSFRNLKAFDVVDVFTLVTSKQPFIVTFKGRQSGAIGLTCSQSISLMALNEESARLQIYNMGFEHCSNFKFKVMNHA